MSRLDRVAALLDEYLVVWVVTAAGLGLAVPSLGRLTPLTTPVLAVMVGSVSLTLSPSAFRQVRPRAVGLRARFPDRVARHDRYYPSVSTLMVVVVIGIVTGASAGIVRGGSRGTLVVVLVGAVALNGLGYALGWLLGRPLDLEKRVTALFSVSSR